VERCPRQQLPGSNSREAAACATPGQEGNKHGSISRAVNVQHIGLGKLTRQGFEPPPTGAGVLFATSTASAFALWDHLGERGARGRGDWAGTLPPNVLMNKRSSTSRLGAATACSRRACGALHGGAGSARPWVLGSPRRGAAGGAAPVVMLTHRGAEHSGARVPFWGSQGPIGAGGESDVPGRRRE